MEAVFLESGENCDCVLFGNETDFIYRILTLILTFNHSRFQVILTWRQRWSSSRAGEGWSREVFIDLELVAVGVLVKEFVHVVLPPYLFLSKVVM